MENLDFDNMFEGGFEEEKKVVEEGRLPSFYQICRLVKSVSMGEVVFKREILDTIKISRGLFEFYKKEALEKAKRLGNCFVEEHPWDKSHSVVVIKTYGDMDISRIETIKVKDGRRVVAKRVYR